jgi:F-type H+-transporting ATPase subunit epsilon
VADADDLMQLEVFLPTSVLVDEPVHKVVAEGTHGFFCLLPRHVDFIAPLVPSILGFIDAEGKERLLATDHGLIVKCGREVLVSTVAGLRGNQFSELQDLVREQVLQLEEQERKARTALARLEAATAGGFLELRETRHD